MSEYTLDFYVTQVFISLYYREFIERTCNVTEKVIESFGALGLDHFDHFGLMYYMTARIFEHITREGDHVII